MILAPGQGHASHFLTRLDRLEPAHVELALSLYNDVELLREILRRARVPERAERACLSLGDPQRGPFLIVTREGRFVTCLGAGMSPGPHPIVTRAQLDAFAAKMSDLRARIELSKRLTGDARPSVRLVARLMRAGMNLSREEFVALSAWSKPLRPFFVLALQKAHDAVERLLPVLIRETKVTYRNEKLLRLFWEALGSVQHFTMLLSLEARELCRAVEDLPPAALASVEALFVHISSTAAEVGSVAAMARALHWSARCGKFLVRPWKQRHGRSAFRGELLGGVTNLACIGLRHERLAAEVRKAIASHPTDDPNSDHLAKAWAPRGATVACPAAVRELLGYLREMTDHAFDRSEELVALHEAAGRDLVFERLARQSGGSAMHLTSAADVPRDLALTALVNDRSDVWGPDGFATVVKILPWVARAKAEDFYLPESALRVLGTRYRPQLVLDHLAGIRARIQRRKPELVGPKLGRNAACACGSGKKRKRCCPGEKPPCRTVEIPRAPCPALPC